MKNVLLATIASAGLAIMTGCAAEDTGTPAQEDVTSSQAALETDPSSVSIPSHFVSVDPYSLHPAAVVQEQPWLAPTPFDVCWKTSTGTRCFKKPISFVFGDGSLEGQDGAPLDWGLPCAQGFSLYFALPTNAWSVIRDYDKNGNISARYWLQVADGKIYNSQTGKATHMSWNYLQTSSWNHPDAPPDGTMNNESDLFTGQMFNVYDKRGKLVTGGFGIANYPWEADPYVKGTDNLDAYFITGDYSYIKPICDMLQ